MVVREAKVANEYGIHCRPSAVIVKETEFLSSEVEVRTSSGGSTTMKSIIELLSLGIEYNDVVTVYAEGPDAEVEADAVVELFQRNFDFPR